MVYAYYPEDGNEKGTINLLKGSNECIITKLAENDEYKTYALHLIKRMKEYAVAGYFKESGVVA